MPSLALAMIVKNEALHLKECLETVYDWVDEIVIIDAGSTDTTEQIAKQFNAKFVINADWQGFGKQRQLAQTLVQSDYILWLDADERVTLELKESILKAISDNELKTVYQVSRLSSVFGKQIRHSGWYPDYVVRLYATKFTSYGDELVHEKVKIPINAKVVKLQGDLLHFTYQNLDQYLKKSAHYAKAWADQRFLKGKKANLFNAVLHAVGCFVKMYILKKGFLDGKIGFLLAILSAHSTFIKYASLWLKSYNKEND